MSRLTVLLFSSLVLVLTTKSVVSQNCLCPLLYSPVCGTDGRDYSNQCDAGCQNVKVACTGKCPCRGGGGNSNLGNNNNLGGLRPPSRPNCLCPANYNPVCGSNGREYSNSCNAGCSNVKVACTGKCPCRGGGGNSNLGNNNNLGSLRPPSHPNCLCPANYNPVCGSNGREYSNSCNARCSNVRVQCNGRCPCRRTGSGGYGNFDTNNNFEGGAERVPLILNNPRYYGGRYRNNRRRF